jgi:hypothetical protein
MPDPLRHINGNDAGEWLRRSVVTFGVDVGSFLPDHFEAYARVDHGGTDGRWEGSLPAPLIPALVEHLGGATTTRADCFFAVWAGFGIGKPIVRFDPGVSWLERKLTLRRLSRVESWKTKAPTLELPERAYHVFSGPIEGATTNLSGSPSGLGWQSANLWWPADHAWCVATEIDNAWTYVGATRQCIDGILADGRLGASERTARSQR